MTTATARKNAARKEYRGNPLSSAELIRKYSHARVKPGTDTTPFVVRYGTDKDGNVLLHTHGPLAGTPVIREMSRPLDAIAHTIRTFH